MQSWYPTLPRGEPLARTHGCIHSGPLINEPWMALSATPLWPRELGKNQPMAGPGRGFEDLERKGFCSPPPQDWQELPCWGPAAFLSTLSKSTNTFSSCQGLMAAWLGPVVAPQGPGSHAASPFEMGSCGSPCQGLRTWPPWQCTSAPKPGCRCYPGRDAQDPCTAPAGLLLIGSKAWRQRALAGQLMSKLSPVAKCVFMPIPLQRASFVAPCPRLLSLPPAILSLKAPEEAAGSFWSWVLVQDPRPRPWAEGGDASHH